MNSLSTQQKKLGFAGVLGTKIAVTAVSNQLLSTFTKARAQKSLELKREKEFEQFTLQDFGFNLQENKYIRDPVMTPFTKKDNMRKLIEKY